MHWIRKKQPFDYKMPQKFLEKNSFIIKKEEIKEYNPKNKEEVYHKLPETMQGIAMAGL
ncbi:hypothetical protein [Chryseobacterium caseinilyticum]|uniref:hypothetical protein n=1 Tax=Chryseobacterium caseinilyticum TaxID=2771428 RepID=UPI00177DA63A|nr:hypothetical protein [Chryseobacterium caseinilyticum]